MLGKKRWNGKTLKVNEGVIMLGKKSTGYTLGGDRE